MSDYFTPEALAGLIRSLLVAAGVGGILDGNQLTALAGAIAVVAGIAWSVVQKKNAKEAGHNAVATAARMVAEGASPEHVISLSKAGLL